MALTAEKVQDLDDKGFIALFGSHRDLWETKAREAYAYATNLVTPTGEPVRPDDVLPLLVPALVLADEFRTFLDQNRLTQKYWRDYFAEFIIDQLWEDLTSNQAQEGG